MQLKFQNNSQKISLLSNSLVPKRTTKICKKQLNFNAAKFKLKCFKKSTLRFEIIYKNLLRDIRKYYNNDFKEKSSFLNRKRYARTKSDYIDQIRAYVTESFNIDLLRAMEVPMEEIVFFIGSLIYPKEMLKYYDSNEV